MPDTFERKKLFTASCIALISTAMTFAFRSSLEDVLGNEFHLTKEDVGWIFSPAFYGFTRAIILGDSLCDWFGMKRLLIFAFIFQIAGVILYLFARNATMLFAGTVCIGIGNGTIEAACNPLVVAFFSVNKTTMLNRFHVWFCGGNVIGGLIGYFMISQINTDWWLMVALLFIPIALYGYLFMKLTYPATERIAKGVSLKEMIMACFNPLFLVILFFIILTGATELGTNQWLGAFLQGAGVSGIVI